MGFLAASRTKFGLLGELFDVYVVSMLRRKDGKLNNDCLTKEPQLLGPKPSK